MIFEIVETKTVNKQKVTEKQNVNIEEGMTFSGKANGEDRYIRKLFGLPLTKDLVYYPNGSDAPIPVDKFEIAQIWNIDKPWFSLYVYSANGKTRIHYAYFSEMQSPSFLKDMAEQEKASD